jgi:hypothetical protein
VCIDLLRDARLFVLLLAIDRDLAAAARQGGCLCCGGRLDGASYPRKPRGALGQLPDGYEVSGRRTAPFPMRRADAGWAGHERAIASEQPTHAPRPTCRGRKSVGSAGADAPAASHCGAACGSR